MSNRKRSTSQTSSSRQPLPPIVSETEDGELPFFRPDAFSDATLLVSSDEQTSQIHAEHSGKGNAVPKQSVKEKTAKTAQGQRKLYTARCILAYNSPVFEKMLGNPKKSDIDLTHKPYDDVVELLCYLDPRVPYTLTAQTAKQLLPLAEEYEIIRLRSSCENVLFVAYEQLRLEYRLGHIPADVNEDFLVLADRYRFQSMLQMCIEEYVNSEAPDTTRSIINSETVSDAVKLVILRRKLSRLNAALDKERRYKHEVESELNKTSPRKKWTNKFGLY